MEKKPNKKEALSIVNNVLKLATKLMKVRGNLHPVLGCRDPPLIPRLRTVYIH